MLQKLELEIELIMAKLFVPHITVMKMYFT